MKLSVCIDAVLSKLAPEAAIRALKNSRADAFEFWSWDNKDISAIKKAMEETNLPLAAMCTSYFNLTDPSGRKSYLEGLKRSIETAHTLNCKTLISQVGNDTGKVREYQHKSIVEGLSECKGMLESEGIILVIEPLNLTIDHKGYYLSKSSEAFDIVSEVGSPNVKVLYDIYHQQVTEGNIINTIRENIDLIGHFHAAGLPGRQELNRGELYYPAVFDAIDHAGYQGYVGLEYMPAGDPLASIEHYDRF